MTNETLFYAFGLALVVSAVLVSIVGLRFKDFPPSRGVLAGTVLYFAVLVGVTAVFAVLNAQDEQEHREAEQAAEAETEATTTPEGGGNKTTTPSGGGASGGETIKLAASPSEIAYDTDSLTAKAGSLTIDFDNPNPALPHDVCVEQGTSELGCSDQVTGEATTLALSDLKPGEYTFFCSVPGHEESGMKGTLTVQ
jgi:plastocyanin